MANILVFGSSITLGFNDFEEGGWVGRFKKFVNKINKKHNLSHAVYNLGVDGDDTQGLLKRFRTEATPRCWPNSKNVIIFEIGVNDSIVNTDKTRRVKPEEFEANLKKLIKEAKSLTDDISFITLTPVIEGKVTPMPWSPSESYYEKEVDRYDKILRRVCEERDMEVIDLFQLNDKEQFKRYLDDGVHPNTEGHKKIFEIVRDFLVEQKLI